MIDVDVHQPLDPQLASIVGALPFTDVSHDVLPLIRSAFPPAELSDKVERRDIVVPGDPVRDGADVTIRVHRTRGSTDVLPCVYSIHGGGYVAGSYEMD